MIHKSNLFQSLFLFVFTQFCPHFLHPRKSPERGKKCLPVCLPSQKMCLVYVLFLCCLRHSNSPSRSVCFTPFLLSLSPEHTPSLLHFLWSLKINDLIYLRFIWNI